MVPWMGQVRRMAPSRRLGNRSAGSRVPRRPARAARVASRRCGARLDCPGGAAAAAGKVGGQGDLHLQPSSAKKPPPTLMAHSIASDPLVLGGWSRAARERTTSALAPLTPDSRDPVALERAPPLGDVFEDQGWTGTFDRTQWVLTLWFPSVLGDHGRRSAWPNSPPLPGPVAPT